MCFQATPVWNLFDFGGNPEGSLTLAPPYPCPCQFFFVFLPTPPRPVICCVFVIWIYPTWLFFLFKYDVSYRPPDSGVRHKNWCLFDASYRLAQALRHQLWCSFSNNVYAWDYVWDYTWDSIGPSLLAVGLPLVELSWLPFSVSSQSPLSVSPFSLGYSFRVVSVSSLWLLFCWIGLTGEGSAHSVLPGTQVLLSYGFDLAGMSLRLNALLLVGGRWSFECELYHLVVRKGFHGFTQFG